MKISSKKQKKKINSFVRIVCITGALAAYSGSMYAAVVGNNTLPTGGEWLHGGTGKIDTPINSNVMNLVQNGQNAVIKWGDFSIGANATVNFSSNANGQFNVLNYVDNGKVSQIYGGINAKDGNVFVVNTAGAIIGKSAQINVGSLYVSNKKLDESKLKAGKFNSNNLNDLYVKERPKTAAEIMSLGNINANKVTFEGDRIVLDINRLVTDGKQMAAEDILLKTSSKNNVVAGYDAYDEENEYEGKNTDEAIATINTGVTDAKLTKKDGYMWVKTLAQLQAMNTNLEGNYALNDSIDAIPTHDWNEDVDSATYLGFKPIGSNANDAFKGKFDGLDYNIFGLTINSPNENNVGLFGYTDGATINNVTLVAGNITGNNNVGSVVGYAKDTNISNVTNSVDVIGTENVGGVVGKFEGNGNNELKNIVNIGITKGHASVGGIAGNMTGGKLTGQSYNLGAVTGIGKEDIDSNFEGYSHDIGGLVGSAANVQLGDGKTQIFNQLNITGGYNVGGIAGSIKDGAGTASSIKNAVNNGNVLAVGYTTGEYKYHSSNEALVGSKDTNGNIIWGEQVVGIVTESDVNIANAGGIAGSVEGNKDNIEIKNVQNNGNVTTKTEKGKNKKTDVTYDYYIAGNVGGVVGMAKNVNITDAKNEENYIRGAHNVGGIAGYFENGRIDKALNDGGDIMATGARVTKDGKEDWATEIVGAGSLAQVYNVGNVGGIVGYMYGDNASVVNSGNRGVVHSEIINDTENIKNENNIKESSKVSSIGGLVGRIDADQEIGLNEVKDNESTNFVSQSYNTGDVFGYTNLGGVIGYMWNGAVTYSYNLGNVTSSRVHIGNYVGSSLNMGGIVGSAGEKMGRSVIYNVFNKGSIGDPEFNFYGRHVGGVVGNLAGHLDTAFNSGNIYNGDSVVGGIAGYWQGGDISNVFNTGNINVIVKNEDEEGAATGGLIGVASGNFREYKNDDSIQYENDKTLTLSNAYNLGIVRGTGSGKGARGYVAGVIAKTANHNNYEGEKPWTLELNNIYTTGNLWSNTAETMGYIWGGFNESNENKANNIITANNVCYMLPDGIFNYSYGYHDRTPHSGIGRDIKQENKPIIKEKEIKPIKAWEDFINQSSENESGEKIWRIYDNTTPILNAFTPETMTSGYFENSEYTDSDKIFGKVQYGTAYDPFLTIINANQNISVDWRKAGFGIAEGLVVNGAGVNITNFGQISGGDTVKDLLPYGGTIYSDGLTSISSDSGNNIFLGSAAKIYGSAVEITSGGDLTINGLVQSTGIESATEKNGDVALSGNNVTIYGEVKSAQENEDVVINGIGTEYIEDLYSYIADENGNLDKNNITYFVQYTRKVVGYDITKLEPLFGASVNDLTKDMPTIGDYLQKKVESEANGSITITANKKEVDGNSVGGNVKILFGNEETGFVNAGGNLTVSGNDVYMDSDLLVGGNLTINGNSSVLDISNIGKVQTSKGLIDDQLNSIEKLTDDEKAIIKSVTDEEKALIGLHKFLDHFQDTDENGEKYSITMKDSNAGNNSDAMITVDLWGKNAFDLDKLDLKFEDNEKEKFLLGNKFLNKDSHTLSEDLKKLNLTINDTTNDSGDAAREYVHIWISDGEQLKGIQTQVNALSDDNVKKSFLEGNFALKNDIDASAVEGYQSIGAGVDGGFTGKFDGRGNRIIGLNIQDGAGVFDKIGAEGSVDDVRIYSSQVSGVENVGMVAGTNSGSITNIITFGNDIAVSGAAGPDNDKKGMAGGIVGTNSGSIANVSSTSIVESTSSDNAAFHLGGIAGVNKKGASINNSEGDSALAITEASSKNTGSIGGIVGTNNGSLEVVSSSGVISGLYRHFNGNDTTYHVASHVGGIAGINGGTITEAYNDSIVAGMLYVGGIVGKNEKDGKIENIANATYVYGGENVGGVAGYNDGNIKDGRNNGAILGAKGIVADKDIQDDDGNTIADKTSTGKNIGGLVGYSGEKGVMSNLVNDMSASITGYENVGGIIGENHGVLTDSQNLMNKGTISGVTDVGGIIGENYGIVANINNQNTFDIVINKAYEVSNDDYKYFGGIVGHNMGKGIVYNVSNSGNVIVNGAYYVGGVIGQNDGIVLGTLANSGNVQGTDNVGGVIGINSSNIDAANDESKKAIKELAEKGIKLANDGKAVLINGAKVKVDENGQAKFTEFVLHENIVSGTNNVGGVIGVNGSDNKEITIKNSDVINTVAGTIIGVNSVGGIIGVNKGDVAGGRDENNKYYANHVYNNGVVKTGTYDVSAGKFTASAGTNIGGLVGVNEEKGTIDAAYNTGAIYADGSSNVGGIAGTNKGTLSQVFNNVMTADGKNAHVKGGDNVGGLVGVNEVNATLQNAYNAAKVIGTTANGVVGNAVADNSGTVSNVFDVVNTGGTLIGSGTGKVEGSYSTAAGDQNNSNVKYVEQADVNKKATYNYNLTDENIWKFYDGYQTPLLKVFLTKAEYNGNVPDFTYNGQEQGLSVDNITAADDKAAYYNANALLQALKNINAGKDYLAFVSDQIAQSDNGEFNPNNLGYDIDTKYTINKAKISDIILDNINRVYGNETITDSKTPDNTTGYNWVHFVGENDYGYSVQVDGGLTDEMKAELGANNILGSITDGALAQDNSQGKVTNDVGEYEWSGEFNPNSDLAKNYEFIEKIGAGTSTVTPAKLNITADDKTISKGEIPKYTGKIDGLVNGDDKFKDYHFGISITDDGLTQQTGTHSNVIGIYIGKQYYDLTTGRVPTDSFWKNYYITGDPGDLIVTDDHHYTFWEAEDKYAWTWDKKREERERKAEVHFVDGGMKI